MFGVKALRLGTGTSTTGKVVRAHDNIAVQTSAAVTVESLEQRICMATTPVPLTVAIGDHSQNEGNSGNTTFNFPVTLSKTSTQDVIVKFMTANSSAVAGSDFTGVTTGSVTIPKGKISVNIPIQVTGDTTKEALETFFVKLTSVTGAAVADGVAIGGIANDDTTAGGTTGGSGTVGPINTAGLKFELQIRDGAPKQDPNTQLLFANTHPKFTLFNRSTTTAHVRIVEFKVEYVLPGFRPVPVTDIDRQRQTDPRHMQYDTTQPLIFDDTIGGTESSILPGVLPLSKGSTVSYKDNGVAKLITTPKQITSTTLDFFFNNNTTGFGSAVYGRGLDNSAAGMRNAFSANIDLDYNEYSPSGTVKSLYKSGADGKYLNLFQGYQDENFGIQPSPGAKFTVVFEDIDSKQRVAVSRIIPKSVAKKTDNAGSYYDFLS